MSGPRIGLTMDRTDYIAVGLVFAAIAMVGGIGFMLGAMFGNG